MVKPIGYSRMQIWNQVALMGTCVNLSEVGKKFMQQYYSGSRLRKVHP
ncbi:MAG: hypothetical protein V7K90_01670 [Nostoc sp.]